MSRQQVLRKTYSVHPATSIYAAMREYTHPVLLNKLQSELGISREDAEVLFEDVKRFLALAASTPQSLAPTKKLDAGWHAFILFTREYGDFCSRYCGRFIHHAPEDPFSKSKDRRTIPATRRLARTVFGKHSENWMNSKNASCESDCNADSCQSKDCSANDCRSPGGE